MSLPKLEQYRQAAAKWCGEHKGVHYELSHHGVSEYQPQGTWCFYIFINEGMFIKDESFTAFDREPKIQEIGSGSKFETYDYWDVPDYGFHGGITFYERTSFVDKEGVRRKQLKIGCDYNHLFDLENGYWEGLDEVRMDTHRLIESLVQSHPIKLRCKYSGKIDLPENFYEAQNGNLVHVSQEATFTAESWPTWMRKSA